MSLRSNAFTLIEISIVLVVIGLISAGVISGKTLIKQAQMRRDAAFVTQTQIALAQFKTEYLAIAGDFSEATSYWSTAVNGNGDGTYGSWYCPGNLETYTVWQHLSLAGYIPGNFTGTQISGTAKVGANVPATSMDSSGYWCAYYGDDSSVYPNHNKIVAAYNEAGAWGLFQQQYVAAIDRKIDDGFPKMGRFISICTGETPVSSATDKSTVYYIGTLPLAPCEMSFAVDPNFRYK